MTIAYALILACLLAVLPASPAEAREWRSWCGTPDAGSPLGWHFYCDRDETTEEEKKETPATQASPPMKPPSATERILSTRHALEEARARAILEPSAENVTAYLALQQ